MTNGKIEIWKYELMKDYRRSTVLLGLPYYVGRNRCNRNHES